MKKNRPPSVAVPSPDADAGVANPEAPVQYGVANLEAPAQSVRMSSKKVSDKEWKKNLGNRPPRRMESPTPNFLPR